MKYIRILFASIAIFFVVPVIYSQQATTSVVLVWNANPTEDGLLSYNLYKKELVDGVPAFVLLANTSALTYTVNGLGPGRYEFYLTAKNDRESGYSDPAILNPAPSTPTNFRIQGISIQVTIPPTPPQ